MPYMLLIVEPTGQREARSEEEGRDLFDRMMRFADTLRERNLLVDAQSLRTDALATRVQVRDGKPQRRDGPFAEAKEMVGGFFLLACDDRETALEIAATCPAAAWATVEVRELGPCFT